MDIKSQLRTVLVVIFFIAILTGASYSIYRVLSGIQVNSQNISKQLKTVSSAKETYYYFPAEPENISEETN